MKSFENNFFKNENVFQEFLEEKTFKRLEKIMLFAMFNFFAEQVAKNKGENSKQFKMDFFNMWYATVREINAIELEQINRTLIHDENTYSAQIMGKPFLSTEDYQKKYDEALNYVKKEYFSATGLE